MVRDHAITSILPTIYEKWKSDITTSESLIPRSYVSYDGFLHLGPFYLDDATKEALRMDRPKPPQEKSAKELREELEAKGIAVTPDAKTKRVLQPIAEENGIRIHKEPKLQNKTIKELMDELQSSNVQLAARSRRRPLSAKKGMENFRELVRECFG